MTQVGLVGGEPFERDLLHGWIRAVGGVRGVHGLVLGSPRPLVDVDIVVAVLDGTEDPVELCRRLRRSGRRGALVAVLPSPSAGLVGQACTAGASAIVAAASGPSALAQAITAAMYGGAWLDPALSPFILDRISDRIGGRANRHGLTAKEMEVARCFRGGLSNRAIAVRLGISEHTVKTHVRSIYRKLDVNDRTAAVAAIRPASSRSEPLSGSPSR